MKISLLTDAPKYNLALMKLSAWHKERGDQVSLNQPLWPADKRYASVLFDWNVKKFLADEYGGPGYNFEPLGIDCRPDYSLYDLDFSLGYTYRYCPRKCSFCVVGKMEKDQSHKSIWDFHLPQFKKICLLNNNTFADPQWKETFQEIWDAKLTMIDENGYDLRLVDEERAVALSETKWGTKHMPHFSWDRMGDESPILRGFGEINRVGLRGCEIYVLVGFDTTIEQDIYRCQTIHDLGHDPYVMVYKNNHLLNDFRTMIYSRCYRKSGSIAETWKTYSRSNPCH
jgi:hypothetical protein